MSESKPKIVLKLKPKSTLPLFVLRKEGSVYLFDNEVKSSKFAIFDMDNTLIKSDDHGDHWEWMYENVPTRLRSYSHQGWKIIIISNQRGISKGDVDPGKMTQKLKTLYERLQIPIEIYLASENDHYRKPMTDLWERILKRIDVKPDPSSFYCGDAAGRIKGYLKGRPKDFAITDRYFAYNCGLRFITPETMFLDIVDNFSYLDAYRDGFELKSYLSQDPYPSLPTTDRRLIIMIGSIATGKTTLSQTFSGSVQLNGDTLKNTKKMMELFEMSITAGRSIVIDNTNPKRETRSTYIQRAKQADYKVYAYYLDFPKLLSIHLNHMRVQIHHGGYPLIPIVAIHTYYKYLDPPQSQEGFDEIITIKKIHNPNPDENFLKYYNYHYDLTK